MANSYFEFKQFTVFQDRCAMKVGTDGVLLGAWVNVQDEKKILDIGTGTGLLALMLAQRTTSEIYAVEIEPGSCIQAQENIDASPWKERIVAINTSIQEYSNKPNAGFELIVSNPPFFSNSLKAPQKERTLARHNDQLLPDELLSAVNVLLIQDGRFAIILPYNDSSLFISNAEMYQLYCIRKTVVRSSIEKRPHRILMEFNRYGMKLVETELIIYKEQDQYSDDYKNLTGEFYPAFQDNKKTS